MKSLILTLTLLTSLANADTLRVAVIDTGLNLNDPRFSGHLCSTGHKDFTGTGLIDNNDHGTFIAGKIQEYAKNGDYCLLIYKYYQDSAPGSINLQHEIEAIKEAVFNKAQVVNISGGGPEFNEEESLLIKSNPHITFVVSAGNDGKNLDIPENEYYPGSYFYANEFVIGSVDANGIRSTSSNYGKKVENTEIGEMVHGLFSSGRTGYMSGTSMSTAIFTGKLIRKMLNAK